MGIYDAVNLFKDLNKSNAQQAPQKTSYQQNLATPVQTTQPTRTATQKAMETIAYYSTFNPKKATELYNFYNMEKSNPNSKYYNTYSDATNKSVMNLATLGFDTNNLNDEWFSRTENQNWIRNNLSYNGTTNTPSKPGKKATRDQLIAYELYQYDKSEATTKKAEQQWQALQEELTYWAKNENRNYSDEYIIDHIDWSKYGELDKMRNKIYEPNEYNRAIGYSDDAIRGVLWAARNDGGTGNNFLDSGFALLGEGNHYVENPEITAKLNVNDENTYSPYSVGMTLEEEGLYFGVSEFTRETLDQIRKNLDFDDATAREYYQNAEAAYENTQQAKYELDLFTRKLDEKLKHIRDPKDAEKIVTDLLGSEVYDKETKQDVKFNMLNKMDDSLVSTKLIPTTSAIDYRKQDMIKYAQDKIIEYASKPNSAETSSNPRYNASSGMSDVRVQNTTSKADAEKENVEKRELNDAKDLMGNDISPDLESVITNTGGLFFEGAIDAISKFNPYKIFSDDEAVRRTVSGYANSLIASSKGHAAYENANLGLALVNAEMDELGSNIYATDEEAASLESLWKSIHSGESGNALTEESANVKSLLDHISELRESGQGSRYKDSYGDPADYYLDLYNTVTGEDTYIGDPEWEFKAQKGQEWYNYLTSDKEKVGRHSDNDEERINELRQKATKYQDTIDQNAESYADYNRAIEMNNSLASLLDAMGIDSLAMKTSGTVSDYILGFEKYKPTKWTKNDFYSQLLIDAGEGATYETIKDDAEAQHKMDLEDLENLKWAKEYAAENGIEIPEPFKKNMDREEARLNRELAAYDYFMLRTENDFESIAEKGKALEEKEKIHGTPRADEEALLGEFSYGLDQSGYYSLMTEDERNTYYYIYATEGKNAAYDYVAGFLGDPSYGVLHTRNKEDVVEKGAQEEVNSGFWGGAWANAKAIGSAPLDSAASLGYMLYTLFSGEEFNPNYAGLSLGQYSSSVYQATVESINTLYKDNEAARKIIGGLYEIMYNRGRSMVNSLATGGLTGGIGNEILKELVGAAPMAVSAMAEAMADAKERGAEDWQMWTIGVVTFLCEDFTEGLTYGNISAAIDGAKGSVSGGFLAKIKDWLTSSGLEEMLGETFTEIVEKQIDKETMGKNSNYNKRLQDVMEQLLADNPDMSPEEIAKIAQDQVNREELDDILHTALISYLSPGADVPMSYVSTFFQQEKYARKAVKGASANGQELSMSDARKQYKALRGNIEAIANADEYTLKDTISSILNDGSEGSKVKAAFAAENIISTFGDNTSALLLNVMQSAVQNGKNGDDVKEAIQTASLSQNSAAYRIITSNAFAAASPSEQINMLLGTLNADRNNGAVQHDIETAQRFETEDVDASALNFKPVNQDAEITKDVGALTSADGSDDASQTAAIASTFYGKAGTASGDAAQATATFLSRLFNNNIVKTVQNLKSILLGSQITTGTDLSNVKQAIQNAALSASSAARQVMTSQEFAMASGEERAAMLAATVESDQNNETVKQESGQAVYNYRVENAKKPLILNGALQGTELAAEERDTAIAKLNDARNALEKASSVKQAKSDAVVSATKAIAQDPQNKDNIKAQKDALTDLNGAVVQEEQAQDHMDKMQEEVDTAQQKLNEVRSKEEAALQEQAEQSVAQEDLQRAGEAAQIAEQQRIAEEQAAQVQAEEDERTGKTWEDRRDDLIETILDNEYLEEGERREARRKELEDRANMIRAGKINMAGMMNNTEGLLAVGMLGRQLGVDVKITNDENLLPKNAAGKYENGVVYLNSQMIQEGKMTVGQAVMEVALHEFTHYMEGTKQYAKYSQTVMDFLFQGDNAEARMNAAIDSKIQDYREKFGQELTREEAKAEIVADFAKNRLNDRDVVQRFIDTGIAGKIRNALHNINQAIKNFRLTGTERETAEYLRKAERLYQKMIEDAANSEVHPDGGQFSIAQLADATGLEFNENTLEMYTPDGKLVDGVNNRITPEMLNNTPVGMLIDLAENGMTNKKGKSILAPTISSETAQAQRQMFADLANMAAQYKDSNLVWEIASSTLFSAMKSNSDPQYSTTVDFGTICAKTQEIINVMSRVMLEKGRGLTREEVLNVYNETAKADLTVPCPVCYVFSRWMGVPSLLGQMSDYQKRFVVTNADGSINVPETQKVANDYIKGALEKYGDKEGIDKAKISIMNRLKTQEKNRTDALKILSSEDATAEQKEAAQNKHDKAIEAMDALTKDLGEVEAFNWVTQALCKQARKGKKVYNVLDANGNYVVDPDFQLTPDDVLFDLRRTGDFAKYTKNWSYRNTRGAGMGKAIMPYSGESIGDIIYGTTRKMASANPFLTQDPQTAAKGISDAIARALKQNLIGGQRLQSTSDFRPEWGLDYLMSFLELQAVGSKVQMYTKVAEAVPLLASMGADINLSIMGKGKGWHVDENGNYVLDFSDVTGMKYETAKALKDDYSNVQMILVGMNDTHIRLAIADSDIDFVIPWHSSGNSKDTLSSLVSSASIGKEQLETSSDYTDTQSDKVSDNQTPEQKQLWNLRMKIIQGKKINAQEREIIYTDKYLAPLYERFNVEGKDADCYHVKLGKDQAKQIFPYEYWDKSLTKDQADENGRRFVEYCQHFGITPRFSGDVKHNEDGSFEVTGNFAGAVYDENGNITGYDPEKMDTGYWKVLIDRPMYDNDGNYRDQQVVDVTKAKIGNIENGELVNSDMPLTTSAMYGPGYSEQEKNAVDNSLAVINEQSDLRGGQYSDGGASLTDLEVGQRMREVGLDGTADERISRQEEQQSNIMDALSDWNDGSEKTITEVRNFFGNNMYYALDQWLHNTFQKGERKGEKIKADDITMFLEEDAKRIEDGAQSLISGWNTLLQEYGNKDITHNLDADTNDRPKAYTEGLSRARSIANAIFGSDLNSYNGPESKENRGDFLNNDTNTIIRMDNRTINETLSRSDKTNKNRDAVIRILMNADRLIQDAVYVGSHIDYAEIASGANVHYYVAQATAGGDNNAVIFAVHDPSQPGTGYSERAYVIEMAVIPNKKDGAPGDDAATESAANIDLTRQTPSKVSIGDLIGTVNTDRLRFFDKESLSGKQMEVGESTGSFSDGGTSLTDLDQQLLDSGIISQEDLDAYNGNLPGPPTTLPGQYADEGGNAYRQFGRQTAQESDAMHDDVKEYLYNHSTYTRDTNQAQIDRAIDWVRSHANAADPDGFFGAMQAAQRGDFDSISADGQARMLTLMSMAALKGEQTGNHSDELILADLFNKQGTEAGRALQARKIFRLMTPIGRMATLNRMANQINEEYGKKGNKRRVHLSDLTLQAAAVAESEEDFQKVQKAAAAELASQMPANWKEKFTAIRMLSMLGNPRTHIRNLVGNLAFMPAVGLKNKIGAGLEAAFVKKGNRTKTIGLATPESRTFAKQYAKQIEGLLRGESKYNEGNAVQQERKIFGQGNGILSKSLGRLTQFLVDANGNALEAEDWVFLNRHFRNALAGYMTANGLTEADMKGDTLDQATAYAINEAHKATYRDANEVADWMNKVKNPAAKFVINAVLPFKKTPMNILKRGVEYSPISIIRSLTSDAKHLKQWQAYQNGELSVLPEKAISPSQYIDRLSAGLSGTAFVALGALLSSLGFLRGGMDDDDDEFEKLNGSQEYSLEIGGVSFTIDWAAPICMPLFVGATVMEEAKKAASGRGEDVSIGSVLDAVLGIAEPVTQLSMLDGLNSVLNPSNYGDTDSLIQVGEKVITNYATSYVPTLLGQAARTIDTTRRRNFVESGADLKVFRSALEQVENKLPFLSQKNIPYRNVWGEADVSPQGWAAIENFLSPGYGNTLKNDPVTNELKRIYQATGNPSMIPKEAGKTVTINGKNTPLTAEQYDKYVVDRGQTAKQCLTELMESPVWQICDDDTRALMITDAWNYANQIGRHNVDNRIKKDSWVANAEYNGNFVDVAIERAAESNRTNYIKGYGQTMAEALDSNDSEMLDLSVTALEEAGATESEIRGALRDYFKPLYQIAFEENDRNTMDLIEEKLLDVGVGFKGKDIAGWIPSEAEEEEIDQRWLNMKKGNQ